jgi:insertion element IS1 protein InsB
VTDSEKGRSRDAIGEQNGVNEKTREQAVCYTDHDAAYVGVIPFIQHRVISKLARTTNHVERFNCTLRPRVSRLVRASLSFARKLSNHSEALKYVISNDNLTKCAALPESHNLKEQL